VEGIDAAIAEYRRLRETEDPRYVFGISDLITLGHDLRQSGRMEEAIRFYRLNADEYPDYFASHSALAEAYLQRGDTTRALESYRRVLSMNPERYGCPESCYRDKRLDALLANR
jgi:tetratricopeptide (TPR) repeat protein